MITWAAVVAVVIGLIIFLASGDLTVVLSGLAEIGAVVALFALVCAAEALN
jgi:hypothetical protein